GADIHVTDAWDVTTGSSSVIVAVIDTGVDYNNPELAPNMWTGPGGIHGYNFVANNTDPMDDYGHGTHVAGTIAAVGNNGSGMAGIAWNVKIMAVKFLDSSGSGSLDGAISAINYAVNNGATISNNSWGSDSFYQPLADTIQAAAAHGHIFVAAA